jgi:hypothetical protein
MGIIKYISLLLLASGCNPTVERYEDQEYGQIYGTLVNGKKDGYFIHMNGSILNTVEFYRNDSIKQRLNIFEGRVIVQDFVEKDSLTQKKIVDYEYYLKSNNLYTDLLENRYDAGKRVFQFHCRTCHFKLDSVKISDLDVRSSSLLSKLIKIKQEMPKVDKLNLLVQDTFTHKSFIHMDTVMLGNIYRYLLTL